MPGVDAGFLAMETPTLHMHTLKIALLDVADVPVWSFEELKDELVRRLHLLPPFRRRVVQVPLHLNHPLWVEDHDVDPDRHVHHHVLPDGSGMRELEDLIGEVASTPLDRSLPLWEMHVVEGIGSGRVAVVTKMHHALADGVAANALLANITDEGPGVGSERPLEPTPQPRQVALRGLLDAVRQIAVVPGLLKRTLLAVMAVLRLRGTSEAAPPRPLLDTPRTSFNGAITARRLFATTTLPLEELKRVRKAVPDVTLNDVVLAVVAGALRSWLLAKDQLPAKALTAGVPVGTDVASDRPRLIGNRVSTLFTSLHTDIADPLERLRAIARTTSAAKEFQSTLGADMLSDWSQFAPPGLLGAFMRGYSRLRGADRHPAPFNVVVSNVPGPREPVTFGGARLTELFSVGPILEGIALNVTVWSYLDQMHFSLLTCPDNLPDLRAVATRLRNALDDLLAAAL